LTLTSSGDVAVQKGLTQMGSKVSADIRIDITDRVIRIHVTDPAHRVIIPIAAGKHKPLCNTPH
jgi:hypothetical protein